MQKNKTNTTKPATKEGRVNFLIPKKFYSQWSKTLNAKDGDAPLKRQKYQYGIGKWTTCPLQ